MQYEVLDVKYVINHGMDYEELESELFTDKLLSPDDNNGYTGLVFEKCDKDTVYWYCNYIDGYREGICISLYEDESIKEIAEYTRNLLNGEYNEFDENGNLLEEGKCCFGVCVRFKKFDPSGNILQEKNSTTEQEDTVIKIRMDGINRLKEDKCSRLLRKQGAIIDSFG